MTGWENRSEAADFKPIAGVDEVGRGCLFGPVVAAAVVLPAGSESMLLAKGVKDSKQLSAIQRSRLYPYIREVAIDCKLGLASVREIDRFNILQASLLAMKRAVLKLQVRPELCQIDGNREIPDLPFPQQTLVKGDCHSVAIACASIVAKVWRDESIARLAERYPHYDLANNKGYGSPKHRQAIQVYGICDQHRRSFRTCQV